MRFIPNNLIINIPIKEKQSIHNLKPIKFNQWDPIITMPTNFDLLIGRFTYTQD